MALINELGESLITGDDDETGTLRTAFKDLDDYARLHFRQEEAMMAKEGISAAYLEQHCRYHADFSHQLAQMWAARGATTNTAEVLHSFLRAWLAMHILGEDQSMARQLAAIRGGLPADQAYEREASHDDNATAALLAAIRSLYQVLTQQNAGLLRANHELEARVLERTQALAQANDRLQALSNSDGLLGIANRRHFDDRLDTEWRRAVRQQRPMSLLMIDVDHFKLYNDHYGHPAGDACLQAVARAAGTPLAAKRPADLLARYGGEELVVLLPDTPAAGAWTVADEIQRAIGALRLPHAASPVAPTVTVCIGTATVLPTRGGTSAELLLAADAALYAAKAAGRNGIVAHSTLARAQPFGTGQPGRAVENNSGFE